MATQTRDIILRTMRARGKCSVVELATASDVSPVSAYPGVRAALTAQQRRIGSAGRVVMVGRDIGTVVMPDADLKIYLDAAVEERARRRYREMIARGEPADYDAVLRGMQRRDVIDSTRATAPLRPAPDAVVLDTTCKRIDQVVQAIEDLLCPVEER